MPSGTTAQDPTWASREQGEEAIYIREKEQAQLAALREEQKNCSESTATATSKDNAKDNVPKHSSAAPSVRSSMDRDFEGGFGGQEDLEDRYATTSGEH